MKKPLFYVVSLLLTIAFAMVSCSKDKITIEELDPDPEPKDEYMVICEKAAEVHGQILKIYDEYSSIKELEEHIDEIKAIENVEDVYFTNTSMFVDIKDFRTVSYSSYPEPELMSEEVQEELVKQMIEMDSNLNRSDNSENPLREVKKVAIINQHYKNESLPSFRVKVLLDETEQMFQEDPFGFSPVIINNPDVSFFKNSLLQYDITFLVTHGIYDSKEDLHWLTTSEEINDDNSTKKRKENFYRYKDYPPDEVSFDYGFVPEIRNGTKTNITYAKISDKFIENLNGSYDTNAIVFVSACHSMQGSKRMAKAFCDYRGAGAYLGYDEEVSVSVPGGRYFLQRMFSGMSLDNAIKNLPSWVVSQETYFDEDHKEKGSFWAKLNCYYNPSCPEMGQTTITHPQINDVVISEANNTLRVSLQARSILHLNEVSLSEDLKNYWTKPNYSDYPSIRYGFELSENEFFKNVQKKEMGVGYENCEFENDAVTYSWTLEYKPGQTNIIKPDTYYFVRAYFYDGYSTYYSDMKYFKTPKFENGNITGGGTLPDVPGTDF